MGDRREIVEKILNDTHLNRLYLLKDSIYGHSSPTITYNLSTQELIYKVENPILEKIDKLIEERINQIKK
jgi:hypothetical protein